MERVRLLIIDDWGPEPAPYRSPSPTRLTRSKRYLAFLRRANADNILIAIIRTKAVADYRNTICSRRETGREP